MSIVTKTGDHGTTALMYGRRVSKADPRVEAVGTVDELTAALGNARALGTDAVTRDWLLSIQRDLIGLMGELSTHSDDLTRYVRDGFSRLDAARTSCLEGWLGELEATGPAFRGWAIPGANAAAAALDIARTVCRRAERRICGLQLAEGLANGEILVYLNRLSDLLWLLARKVEGSEGSKS
jgi:cob(I)alamin adenosyltransferase